MKGMDFMSPMNAKNYLELKEMTGELVRATEDIAVLIGEERKTETGFYPGLGRVEEAEMFRAKGRILEKGLFNLMTLGAFKTGKSTLVNAIVGLKVVKTKTVACSAVVTEITKGSDTDHAMIYYRDGRTPSKIPLEQFIEQYALTVEDEAEAYATGRIARFEMIDHAVIESDSRFCEYGLTLIDSPGLEDKATCTEIATGYVSKADAVIYCLRADTGLFTQTDKEYLERTYYGKSAKNAFFVINRINLVPEEEREEVRSTALVYLKDVFTDENGRFDEELYNRRVFFVDALGAYNGKIAPEGDSKRQLYEESGVPEFEAELEHFLLSGERYAAMLQSVLTLMANAHVQTETDNKLKIAAREKDIGALEAGHADAMKVLSSLDREIDELSRLFKITKETLVAKLSVDLDDYIREMEKTWDEDCLAIENGIGFGKLMKLGGAGIVGLVSKEKKQEIIDDVIKPMADEISAMFEKKLNKWGDRVETLVAPDMEIFDRAKEEVLVGVNEKLSDATALFLGGKVQVAQESGKANGLMVLLSSIQGNVSDIIYMSGGGGMSWKEYLSSYLVQGVMQVLILSVIGGPIGLAAFFVAELIQTIFRANKMNKNILHSMKGQLFSQLRDGVSKGRESIDEALTMAFAPVEAATIKVIADKRTQAIELQEKILRDRTASQEEYDREKNRLETILSSLAEKITVAYESAFGKKMEEGDISKLAALE